MKHVVIIGNGIAGVTAARHIRKLSNHRITIVSKESKYFYSRTALMYIYMGHMREVDTQPYEPEFWVKNRIELIHDEVLTVDYEQQTLALAKGDALSYDSLVIATGSIPNKFGWPGQDGEGVQGLYSLQDLELLEKNAPNAQVCKRAVIIGGGLIGIELAEMMLSRDIPVTFLVREKRFWNSVLPDGEADLITRHIRSHHVDLRTENNLEEILLDEHGKVRAIRIAETGEEIPCNLVGLTAGVSPNVAFLKGSALEVDKGVLVNRMLETNIPNVYAIGDCAQQRVAIGERRPVEAVWYTGKMMGETLAQTLCGKPMEYQPNHWFNSAKFFDIEYQTYGWVWSKAKENEEQFYWEHPDGDKAITIAFDKATNIFLGINTFGIRMRHTFFHKALEKKATVDKVVSRLRRATFDPEFYKSFEEDILHAYNSKYGTALTLASSTWANIMAPFSK